MNKFIELNGGGELSFEDWNIMMKVKTSELRIYLFKVQFKYLRDWIESFKFRWI